MILLKTTDFSGFQLIALNNQTIPTLQAYIDKFEKTFLQKILGINLANLFIADLANATQDPRFAVIEDLFAFEQNQSQYFSQGLKMILASMVYYEFVSNTQSGHSSTGVYGSINESMTNKSDNDAYRYGEIRWNDALDSIEAIQWYCKTYANQLYPTTPAMTYPEYNGQDIEPKCYFVL